MDQTIKCFYLEVSTDRLTANLHCTDEYNDRKTSVERKLVEKLLAEFNITYGVDEDQIELLLSIPHPSSFPIEIANGTPAQNGKDGKVVYDYNFSSEVRKTANWNFRDVMRIPSVENEEKLATIVPPTSGEKGKNVFGHVIRAKPGKPVVMNAGKNVEFNETDSSFYATIGGQVSVQGHRMNIQPVFEVQDSLSMETGNIEFIGSVIIHGDVPTGYTVKADGDIKVFGMVEAAKIISGASIYISEGFAGLQKGHVQAAHNIHVGYINQGAAHAGETIYVENSILHSECEANKDIFCQQGNIIGGSLSAGQMIEAKDIGNRLSTKTKMTLGASNKTTIQENDLLAKKKNYKVH